MTTLETVKAWKDEDYRDTLTPQQKERLPQHPSGVIEFVNRDLPDEASFGTPPVACPKGSGGVGTWQAWCCKPHSKG